MELFPAIDLRDGKAVRLVQGDYNQMTVFSDRPEEVALGFKEQGAKNLHVVDLDGAKDAVLANFDTIEKLIKTTGLFVEVGGGIRNEASIDKYLSLGAGRVILGTVAVTNYPFVEEMVRKYGDKIAVGVDAKGRLSWLLSLGGQANCYQRGHERVADLKDRHSRNRPCEAARH